MNTIKTRIFPCKSIRLKNFMREHGVLSEHKYIDKEDGKTCWIFVRDITFNLVLSEYHKNINKIK